MTLDAGNASQMNGSPAKKRKLEEDVEANTALLKSQKTYTKHETHWNLDGSLLLQIGNTRFKVHKSRLVSESPFFAALIDQRSGVSEREPYLYQSEIDEALSTVEDVDGIELFFLDLKEAPSAEEFATLLTAMNQGM